MPASDFVFMQDSAQLHHVEPKQLRIFFKKAFPDFASAELWGLSLVSVVPIRQAEE